MSKYMFTTLKVYDRNYIYDGNKNALIKIPKEDWETLDNMGSGYSSIIEKYQKTGICEKSKIKKIKHDFSDFLGEYLKNSMKRVILQVTQNCNLRCSYCTYSGTYNNRKHNNKRMSLHTAKKSIDFLISHSYMNKVVNIAFYGGEPLLEISLIKKIVDYIKHKYKEKTVIYSLTTNGTLLNEEIIKFLSENKFILTISLDGSEKTHNINRKFMNGEGSHEKIIKNLFMIKDIFPSYYSELNINSVLSPEHDMQSFSSFFNKNDLFKNINVKWSPVSDLYTENKFIYGEKTKIINFQEKTKFLLWSIKKISKEHVSIFYNDELVKLQKTYLSMRSQAIKSETSHPGGPCFPGATKLFVDTSGNFFPCEKVSEESSVMKIGNLEKGFDEKKILEILNIGEISSEECKNCWNFIYCGQCAAYADNGISLCKQKRLSNCEKHKTNTLGQLNDICFLKENNFDFHMRGR